MTEGNHRYNPIMKQQTGRSLIFLYIIIIFTLPVALLFWLNSIAHSHVAGQGTFFPVLAPVAPAKFDAVLLEAMQSATATDVIRIIIHLAPPDLTQRQFPADSNLERRAAIVQWLQDTAVSTQFALRQELDALAADGRVSHVRPFWIVNAIALRTDPATLQTLAAHPDVIRITLDIATPIVTPLHPDLNDWVTPLAAPMQDESAWGVQRIRAPYVWHGLGHDGSGVTMAIMDSGVDWTHPVLSANYRGNLGNGVYQHAGNWYHAAIPTATVPFDLIGHGTHVAGTAVGQNDMGVAPGARWIAVAISDANGLIYDSAIHAGFEWLLAPNGSPALAPDIVNASWGGRYGVRTEFYADIQLLQTAGIIPVFSAGNNGPDAGTINSPASYTNTLAVAASDDIDAVAWFSSRGPSPLTAEVKPFLAAPGTRILSTFPGGGLAVANGTSMAAPHLSGALALLLDANPALTPAQIMLLLADTAVPMTAVHPNNDSGWGRLDAYAAVVPHANTGRIQGLITRDGVPLPQVVVTVTTPAGVSLRFDTDARGQYRADLQPGSYTLTTAPFGSTSSQASVTLAANQTVTRNFPLASLPAGALSGQVQAGGLGIAAVTVAVVGTPVVTQTNENGRYTLSLPAGTYTVRISANGYRLVQTILTIQAGQAQQRDFLLTPAPSVLLIDGGQWYFNSFISYYEAALIQDYRSFTQASVRDPFHDVPTAADLMQYDVVIWADPQGAPGLLQANNVITTYLGSGGHFLISGQNVGRYDGLGFGSQVWWLNRLRASFTGELTDQPLPGVSGAAGTPFATASLTFNGADSARNQTSPDHAMPQALALTEPLLFYEDGQAAGLGAGQCDPYRIVYWGFGLEGVTGAANRADLLGRSFAYLAAPPIASGARWLNRDVSQIVLPGDQLAYTLTVQNLSETLTDTLDLTLTGAGWPAVVVTPTLTLGPCMVGQTTLTVTVPTAAPDDQQVMMTLTAVSRQDTAVNTRWQLSLKTPGNILLVDDDRFYENEVDFHAALQQMGARYDVWDIGGSSLQAPQGSPPAALLPAYDLIIWFTAYNWYDPVTSASRLALRDYAQGGGRLFLSSQDLLYYPLPARLQSYLGVLDYQVDVTPTVAYGADHTTRSSLLDGPLSLTYSPIKNQGDGLLPAAHSQPYLWHDQGWVAALTTAGPDWRTVFWGIPVSTLSETMRSVALSDALGWLGDLGDSTWQVDNRTGPPGAPRTYTLTIRNWPAAPTNQIVMTNTLPPGLEIVPGSLRGSATYDTDSRQVRWQGALLPGGSHQITYQAAPDAALPSGTRLDNSVTLAYARHQLRFDKVTTVWLDAPDLRASWLLGTAAATFPTRTITYTLLLRNQGLAAAEGATAVLRLPDSFAPLTATLSSSAGLAALDNQRVNWQGAVLPGETITISLLLTTTVETPRWWFVATAVLDDGVTTPLVRSHVLMLPPHMAYFSFIAHAP